MKGIWYPELKTSWTQGSEVLSFQTSATFVRQPPIASAQGDGSYF